MLPVLGTVVRYLDSCGLRIADGGCGVMLWVHFAAMALLVAAEVIDQLERPLSGDAHAS